MIRMFVAWYLKRLEHTECANHKRCALCPYKLPKEAECTYVRCSVTAVINQLREDKK